MYKTYTQSSVKSIRKCKNPYIINENHIFSKIYYEVISGLILTNVTPKLSSCQYFDCLFTHYVVMSDFYLYII